MITPRLLHLSMRPESRSTFRKLRIPRFSTPQCRSSRDQLSGSCGRVVQVADALEAMNHSCHKDYFPSGANSYSPLLRVGLRGARRRGVRPACRCVDRAPAGRGEVNVPSFPTQTTRPSHTRRARTQQRTRHSFFLMLLSSCNRSKEISPPADARTAHC